jgi:hypothetical protein
LTVASHSVYRIEKRRRGEGHTAAETVCSVPSLQFFREHPLDQRLKAEMSYVHHVHQCSLCTKYFAIKENMMWCL